MQPGHVTSTAAATLFHGAQPVSETGFFKDTASTEISKEAANYLVTCLEAYDPEQIQEMSVPDINNVVAENLKYDELPYS